MVGSFKFYGNLCSVICNLYSVIRNPNVGVALVTTRLLEVAKAKATHITQLQQIYLPVIPTKVGIHG